MDDEDCVNVKIDDDLFYDYSELDDVLFCECGNVATKAIRGKGCFKAACVECYKEKRGRLYRLNNV